VRLIRVATGPDGTFGVLIDKYPICLTLELPWKDNERNISCIPDGTYHCEKIISPKYGVTFEICGVPDRTHILFHWGNTEKDSKGCILLGLEYALMQALDPDSGMEEKQPAIFNSRKGFEKFMNNFELVDSFELEIKWA